MAAHCLNCLATRALTLQTIARVEAMMTEMEGTAKQLRVIKELCSASSKPLDDDPKLKSGAALESACSQSTESTKTPVTQDPDGMISDCEWPVLIDPVSALPNDDAPSPPKDEKLPSSSASASSSASQLQVPNGSCQVVVVPGDKKQSKRTTRLQQRYEKEREERAKPLRMPVTDGELAAGYFFFDWLASERATLPAPAATPTTKPATAADINPVFTTVTPELKTTESIALWRSQAESAFTIHNCKVKGPSDVDGNVALMNVRCDLADNTLRRESRNSKMVFYFPPSTFGMCIETASGAGVVSAVIVSLKPGKFVTFGAEGKVIAAVSEFEITSVSIDTHLMTKFKNLSYMIARV